METRMKLFDAVRSIFSGANRDDVMRDVYQQGYARGRRAYIDGADTGRLHNNWTTSIKTLYTLITDEYEKLVARSEQQMRTNPYAKNARNILIDHIIGPGLRVFPKPKNPDGTINTKLTEILTRDWDRFNDECIRTG
jgi:capsid protein